MTTNKTIKINDTLSLIGTLYSPSTEVKEVSQNSNYIYIGDNSGSMWGEIDKLRETLKRECRKLKIGDTLTLAHFSDYNNYKYFVKSLLITANFDFGKIDVLIDKYLKADGLTCYTQVLKEAKEVIDDIRTISSSDNFSLCFLSDGFPNDHSPMNEILSAIENIRGSVNQSYIIGYGRYYNKPVLSQMAETLGSTLIHNDDEKSFNTTFSNFISQKPEGKNWKIQLNSKNPHFFVNLQGDVVRISGNGDNEAFIPQTKLGIIVWEISNSGVGNSYNNEDLKYLYAAALVLSQSVRTWDAMNVLSIIGDKFLLEKMNSAFTTAQYGFVETLIASAVKGDNRFIAGQHVNCLPDPNAFSFIDLLDILSEDENIQFYPNDPDFKYRRRGKATEQTENLREFTENKNDGYDILNITLHKTRPNVSFLIKKEGKVQLDPADSPGYKEREKLNVQLRKDGMQTIPNQFPTHVFRNYNIITDGDYNMEILPVSISESTYTELKAAGVIGAKEKYGKNKIFKLHLKDLPIVSRKWGKDSYTSTEFAEKMLDIQQRKVEQAVYNYAIKELKPYVEKTNEFASAYGTKGMQFLAERDVTPNGYSPKVATVEPKDFYLSKEFAISIKSFSKISVPDYLAKKEKIDNWDGKGREPKFTVVESLIKNYHDAILVTLSLRQTSTEQKLELLESQRNAKRKELREIEKELNTDKLIFLMTNSDFSDVEERGSIEVPLNENYVAKIDMKETPIYF